MPNLVGRTHAKFGRSVARRGERAHLAVADCLKGRHAAQQQQVDFTQRMPVCEYLWHTDGCGHQRGNQRSSARQSALISEVIIAHQRGNQRSSAR